MGVPTYVIGYDTSGPGNEMFAAVLDGFAVRGGTGDMKHRAVEDEQSLRMEFQRIAGDVISCTFQLDIAGVSGRGSNGSATSLAAIAPATGHTLPPHTARARAAVRPADLMAAPRSSGWASFRRPAQMRLRRHRTPVPA
jgi:hypothetical protein